MTTTTRSPQATIRTQSPNAIRITTPGHPKPQQHPLPAGSSTPDRGDQALTAIGLTRIGEWARIKVDADNTTWTCDLAPLTATAAT